MNDAKYVGMDVHTATISAAVRDSSGNLVMEATIETKAETIREFVHGLRGSLRVSFEEGTCASWLHDLLKPHVSEVSGDRRFKAGGQQPANKSELSWSAVPSTQSQTRHPGCDQGHGRQAGAC